MVVGCSLSEAFLVQKTRSRSLPSTFRFEFAGCLSEALARLNNTKVDAILLDLELPGRQWLDTLRAIIRQVPGLPVVVLTGAQGEAAGQAAVREGAWDYLVKGDYTDRMLAKVLRSVVEHHGAKEARRRSEGFAQAVLDGLSDNIAIIDNDGVIMMVNRAWREFADTNGGDPGRLCEGASYLAVCDGAAGPHSEGASDMAAAIRAVLTGENLHLTMEYPCHSPEQERWFVARLNLLAGGGPPRAIIAHENITERKIAEKQLVASEARLRALYEHSPVGILFTAPDGRVFNANPAACGMLARTEDEIRRLGRSGLLDPTDPNLKMGLAERMRTGKVRATLTYIRADGSRFRADTISLIFDTAEGPRTCTIIQDVSDREAAAERILDFSRRLLGIREEEKHRLSAALHHDVGSMSVGVGARLQAAEEDLHSGKLQEAAAALQECRRLFDDSVQRLKALAMELRPPDLDILGLPAALRQHFAQVTRMTPIQIRFTDATHGLEIDSEIETALFRVAQECLNNVSKHAQASRVRVRLAVAKQSIRLCILDDGVGFAPHSDAGHTTTCMGLQAVREMMRAHGGELTIHSAPGKGTRILAVFPRQGAWP